MANTISMSVSMSKISRRHLLRLAGVTTASAALTNALRAEGFALLAPTPEVTVATAAPIHVRDVTLRARNIDLMKRYYQLVIGLKILRESDEEVAMGVGDTTLLTLLSAPEAPFSAPSEAGLYHTAFVMPSRTELARWLVHVAMMDAPLTGFADHLVSEAVYLDDPEGNGVEVYADRTPDSWTWEGDQVVMASEALDVESLFQLTNTNVDTFTGAPDATRIGHIHLRAGEIEAATAFYNGALGLDIVRGRDGAAFMSSGRYHHHVAVNTWQSEGAGPRNPLKTGLAEFTLQLDDAALLEPIRQRLAEAGVETKEAGSDLIAADPWGTSVRLVVG